MANRVEAGEWRSAPTGSRERRMLSHQVMQGILDRFEAPSYLEVGVAQGVTFHAVRAARKTAVDPQFDFDLTAAKADPAHANCSYFEMTSDVYFSNAKNPTETFDVVFLDGLHVFDQTLKDLLSALACLRPTGVVVVDDVIPSSHAASIPDPERFLAYQRAGSDPDRAWMGDVYRLVFFVAAYLPFLRYATVQENHGQLLLWRGTRPASGDRLEPLEAIARAGYADVRLRRDVFAVRPYADILAAIALAGATPRPP